MKYETKADFRLTNGSCLRGVINATYQEIVDDEHPVVIFAARDIAKILIEHGINDSDKLVSWLRLLA